MSGALQALHLGQSFSLSHAGHDGFAQHEFTNANLVSFTVLASTNTSLPRSNWSILGPPVPIGGISYQFTDPAATNSAQRFSQLWWHGIHL